MKKSQVILNVVLAVAVIVLFFLYFLGGKKACLANGRGECSIVKDSAGATRPRIAYVELDSLNDEVTFIKERKTELEGEQTDMENDYNNAYRQLEAEKNNFLKRGAAITQPEAEAFQQKLIQQQQQIEADKQARSQKLAEKGSQVMEGIQKTLKDFITGYNKDKKYTYILAVGTGLDYMLYKDSTLNITSDVVKGLNDKMNNPQ
ncbi:MAG TPA: OmpH family outer membrane protein [Ferruginibacter sp.]|nr:OmpH family outer membrane protein [Ferruginibacter sp.]